MTFQFNYLAWALELQQKQDEIFWDSENGGYFLSAAGDPLLVVRTKEGEFLDEYWRFLTLEMRMEQYPIPILSRSSIC